MDLFANKGVPLQKLVLGREFEDHPLQFVEPNWHIGWHMPNWQA